MSPSSSSTSNRLTQFHKGIYIPIVTPFLPNEDLDLPSLRSHVVRLGSAGAGLVLQGTTAESIHLTPSERATVIATTREALDGAGLQHIPIIAGCGTGSVRETIELCKDAKKVGADAAMVIAPSFFGAKLKDDRAALRDFWWTTADQSPLPVFIYNFPAVTSGIDLDSDLLEELAAHPNIVGVKLTCGQVGKGHRLATSKIHASHPNRHFLVLTGFSDIMFPSMLAGLQGSITGLGNLTPRLVVRLYDVTQQAISERNWDKLDEARRLSDVVSRADWASAKAGVGGNKFLVGSFYPDTGMGERVRRPLFEASESVKKALVDEVKEAVEWERRLEKEAGV